MAYTSSMGGKDAKRSTARVFYKETLSSFPLSGPDWFCTLVLSLQRLQTDLVHCGRFARK